MWPKVAGPVIEALFYTANLVVLNKIDLLPFVDFDTAQFRHDLARLNPQLPLLNLSCRTGEGISDWSAWLSQRVTATSLAATSP